MVIGCRWQLPCLSDVWLLVVRSNEEAPGLTERVTHQIIANKLLKAWPWILAAPQSRVGEPLEIIFPLYRKNSMATILDKHRLVVVSEAPVTEAQWQRCLTYSLYFWLAPNWNRVRTAVINGRDFLSHSNYQFFVDFRVTVGEDVLVSVFDFGMIKIRPMSLTTLFPYIRTDDGAAQRLQRRLQTGNIELGQRSKCYVLPTLKPAFIASVTAKPTGIFDSFDKIATYWHSLYGYDIDSNLKQNMLYCNVKFFSDSTYTYPSFCVCLDQGSFERHHNTVHLVNTFYRDVDKFLQITGAKLISPIGADHPILQWASKGDKE